MKRIPIIYGKMSLPFVNDPFRSSRALIFEGKKYSDLLPDFKVAVKFSLQLCVHLDITCSTLTGQNGT